VAAGMAKARAPPQDRRSPQLPGTCTPWARQEIWFGYALDLCVSILAQRLSV